MSRSEVISLIVGVVGTLVAVWVAVAGRQLFRPQMALKLGLFDVPQEIPFRYRFGPKDSVAIGVSATAAEYIVLPCPIRLVNEGSLPVTDVEVVFEFPSEALIEDKAIVGPVGSQVAKLQPRGEQERKIVKVGGLAQVRVPIGMLRPGAAIVTGEMFQLKAGQMLVRIDELGSKSRGAIAHRYSSCKTLRGALQVHVTVWSSSRRPIAKSLNLMWFAVNDIEALRQSLEEVGKLSWAEYPLEPGIYFLAQSWKRIIRHEIIHLAVMRLERLDELDLALSPDGLIKSSEGVVVIALPPWGLWGEPFDIKKRWGPMFVWKTRS